MTPSTIHTVYIWAQDDNDPETPAATIARKNGGYREHTYLNITQSSLDRLLAATPPKPAYIDGTMLAYKIRQ